MKCSFLQTEVLVDGRWRHRCEGCGLEITSPFSDSGFIDADCTGMPPEPRPEEEQTELVEVCKTCPDYGDPAEGYEMAAVCQLDDPPAYIDTEPCRKKCMVAAYQKRVQFEGGECGKWKAYLENKS